MWLALDSAGTPTRTACAAHVLTFSPRLWQCHDAQATRTVGGATLHHQRWRIGMWHTPGAALVQDGLQIIIFSPVRHAQAAIATHVNDILMSSKALP